jgi:hypothetical protein
VDLLNGADLGLAATVTMFAGVLAGFLRGLSSIALRLLERRFKLDHLEPEDSNDDG